MFRFVDHYEIMFRFVDHFKIIFRFVDHYEIMFRFVDHYEKREKFQELEACITHLSVMCLDIHQVKWLRFKETVHEI